MWRYGLGEKQVTGAANGRNNGHRGGEGRERRTEENTQEKCFPKDIGLKKERG